MNKSYCIVCVVFVNFLFSFIVNVYFLDVFLDIFCVLKFLAFLLQFCLLSKIYRTCPSFLLSRYKPIYLSINVNINVFTDAFHVTLVVILCLRQNKSYKDQVFLILMFLNSLFVYSCFNYSFFVLTFMNFLRLDVYFIISHVFNVKHVYTSMQKHTHS